MKFRKNILEPENAEKVKNCAKELKNCNLYAKSILINARTGKLLKKKHASKSNLKTGDTKDFKNNVHQQY